MTSSISKRCGNKILQNSAIFFAAMVFVVFIFSSCGKKEEKPLMKTITYDVLINSDNALPPVKDSWWKNNIERSKREAFIKILFDKIDSNLIKVTDENGKELTMDDIKKRMIINDTVVMMKKGEKDQMVYYDTIITLTILPEQINMIRFKESWTYNPETYEVTKHLLSYGLSYSKKNAYSRIRHPEPFFWVTCTDEDVPSHTKKVLTERISYSMPLYEKLNADLLNTVKVEADSTEIKSFIQGIWSFALSDSLNRIKDLDYVTLEFKDIARDSVKYQAVQVLKKSLPEKFSEQEIEQNLDNYLWSFGKTVYFHERWLVDMKTMEISKEVQIIAPGINVWQNGKLIGSKYFYCLPFKIKMWQPL